jgi:hypothetical protein
MFEDEQFTVLNVARMREREVMLETKNVMRNA